MGVRNVKREELARIECKTLDAQFRTLIQKGLGALLTREDLAYHVFFVGTRSLSRDLAALRTPDPRTVIPLRSTVQDIGPVLTHRVEIVRLALAGKTTSEISAILRHSPQAVTNYVATFSRTAFLARRGLVATQIAYLLRRGPGLIARYLDLFREAEKDPNVAYHLGQLLRVGDAGIAKKIPRRRTAHGR